MSSTFLLTRVYVVVLHFLLPEVSLQELNSTLHTTEYGVHFAYDAEYITFTCSTKDSNSIAWSSDEYIGTNGFRLEFASIEREGTARHATDSGAIAQLVNVSRENGKVILLSQLQISVQSRYQVASITCHSIGNDAVNTTTFRMADNASVTCDKPAVCPGDTVTCTCITGYSNIIAWSSDQLIGRDGVRLEFASFQPVLTRLNVSDSSTFAVLIDSSDLNGVSVLESELAFVVSSTLDVILTCENVGRQISDSIIIPLARNCITSTTSIVITDLTTTTADLGNVTIFKGPHNDTSGVSAKEISGIITASVLLPVMIMIVYSIVIMCSYTYMYKKWKQRSSAVESMWSKHARTHVHQDMEINHSYPMERVQEANEVYQPKSMQSEEEPQLVVPESATEDFQQSATRSLEGMMTTGKMLMDRDRNVQLNEQIKEKILLLQEQISVKEQQIAKLLRENEMYKKAMKNENQDSVKESGMDRDCLHVAHAGCQPRIPASVKIFTAY